MTTTTTAYASHPVLAELGLTLPMQADTCWTLSRLDEEDRSTLRLTLAADEELIVEFTEGALTTTRYIFDRAGRLVSALRNDTSDGKALFRILRCLALSAVRDWLPADHQ